MLKDDAVCYEDDYTCMDALDTAFRKDESVIFHGSYIMPVDPLTTDRERVVMVVEEIYILLGYRLK